MAFTALKQNTMELHSTKMKCFCLQSYTLRIYFHSVNSEQVYEEYKSVLSTSQVY